MARAMSWVADLRPWADGGITVAGEFGTRVGGSVVVSEHGFEYLTDLPREFTVL